MSSKMMCRRNVITLLLGLFLYVAAYTQNISNKGKEFWLSYGYCWVFDNEFPTNTQELVLYLSAEAPASVTVSVNGTSWSQTVNIPANTVNATIKIPKTAPDDARIFNEGLFNRGVHIVSDTPIVVYAHEYNNMVSGATMLMPVESYGYTYYSLNYSQSQSGSSPPTSYSSTTQNGPQWTSWFYVVAAEDNTRIEITPTDTTKNGWLPGVTYTVNLNKGQVYNVMGKLTTGNLLWQAGKDLSGSKILSVPGADGNCHKVAVFSGSSGIRLCKNDGGEYMQQQVFPTQAWGTRYLTYHTLNNTTTDINDQFKNFYRIAVADPSTVVKRNGVVMTGLVNNFYYEYLDSLGGDYIEADKPILMAQYTPGGNRCYQASQFAYGDPEMFYLSPLEQGRKDVLFYATRNANIDFNYLNVVVKTVAIPSLRLDGAAFLPANIKAHPNHPGYSVAVARITGAAAQHRLTCDSIFNATVYGLGFFESYGYNVGTFINNLNHYSAIKNVFNTTTNIDTFTCPKSPVRLFVKVGNPATSIHWKLSQVPVISPNADSIINNPSLAYTELINGRTYYVYTLQQDFIFTDTGTFFIPVTYSTAVTQNCSQTEDVQVKVVVKPGPVADFTISPPLCLSDSIRFTGASNANGFVLNNYLWSFDDLTTQTTVNAVKKFNSAGLQNVRYRVIATNGCVGDTTKPVTILPSPLSNFGISGNICARDSVRITDSSSVSVGTITNWWWNFGDGTTVNRTNNSPFFHVYTTAGTYTISLITTSSNNCKSDTVRKQITVYALPVANFGFVKTRCDGDSVLFADSSIATAGNIVSWKWYFGDGTSAINSNNNSFYHNYTAAGTYVAKLVVVSVNGCVSDTAYKTITVGSRPSATISASGQLCADSLQNFISSYAVGASATPNWWWDFGDGQTFTSTTINTATHIYTSALTNITIKHVASSGPGCYSDTAVYVIAAINPNPVVNLGPDQVLCIGTTVLLDATNPNSTYQWQNGSTNPAQNVSVTGVYWVQVQNTAGCKARDTVSITFNPNPIFDLGADTSLCAGDTLTLSAAAGNATSYLWNTGATTATIKATQAGLYWCEARIGTCVFRDSLRIIAVNPRPVVNLGPDQTSCAGNIVLLDATNPNSTYLWQNGNTTPSLNVTVTGVYWVQVQNAAGCITRDTVSVTFNPSPLFNLGADTSICSADTLTLSAAAGNANSYLWNTGATTASIRVFLPGLYWCEARIGNCAFRDSLRILAVNPSPTVNLGSDQVVCSGIPVLLNATNANSTYLWQDGSSNATYNVINPGLYWVQVLNNFGCSRRDSVTITYKPLPVFNLGPDTSICQNDVYLLNAATANANSYQWSTGASTSSISVSSAGLYWCEATLNGCIFRDTLSVLSVKPYPVVNLGNDQNVCEGISVTLDATNANATYFWQNGSAAATYTVTNAGMYHVQVNLNGCRRSDTVNIAYTLKPRVALGNDQAICPGYPIILSPVVNTNWQLRWQDGSSASTYTVNQPGLYSLTATNNCGSGSDDINITKGYCKVIVPNAFTPNNDGLNDLFKVLGVESVTELNLKIFNRWGQLVFETSDKTKGWDGKFKNKLQPNGTFVFILNYKENNSVQSVSQKGTFVLIQ